MFFPKFIPKILTIYCYYNFLKFYFKYLLLFFSKLIRIPENLFFKTQHSSLPRFSRHTLHRFLRPTLCGFPSLTFILNNINHNNRLFDFSTTHSLIRLIKKTTVLNHNNIRFDFPSTCGITIITCLFNFSIAHISYTLQLSSLQFFFFLIF